MLFASKLAAVLAILTVALASPILEARSCTPNFQGNPLTVYKTILGDIFEWTPVNAVGGQITLLQTPASQAFTNPAFLVEFTGQPDNAYHFKMTADTAHELQLAGAASGELSFAPITFSGTSQNFGIECSSCSLSSPDAGVGCVITHTETGTCVTGNSGGATLALATCDGTFAQQFNFHV